MKDFIRTLKENLILEWTEPLFTVLIPVIGGVIGIIMTLFSMSMDGTGESYGKVGAFMVLVLGILFIFFTGIFSLPIDFNLAVSMGKTRKSYVPARFIILALDVLAVILIFIIFNAAEEALYTTLYPNAVCELDVGKLLHNPALIAGTIFLLPTVNLLCGALLMRFPTKFVWVLWAIWMIVFTGGPKMITAAEKKDSVFGQLGAAILWLFQGASPIKTAVAVVIITVMGMAVTMRLFSRQRVTL